MDLLAGRERALRALELSVKAQAGSVPARRDHRLCASGPGSEPNEATAVSAGSGRLTPDGLERDRAVAWKPATSRSPLAERELETWHLDASASMDFGTALSEEARPSPSP
jgi:hypothetical protein